MDFGTLVQTYGPYVGGLLFFGVSFARFVWPRYEKHMERRTAATEQQAKAFERIADVSEQMHARLGEVYQVTQDTRLDIAGLYGQIQQAQPSRRPTTRKIVTPAQSGS